MVLWMQPNSDDGLGGEGEGAGAESWWCSWCPDPSGGEAGVMSSISCIFM